MSFWSDISKTVNAPNWYDNPNPVVLGYGDDGQGNLTPDYGDIFKYLRGSSDPETGSVTPDNQAAMDAFKNLPVLPNLTNIDPSKRTGMLNGRQVQWGMPGTNAEEWSPGGDGLARAMSTQGDTRFAQIAGRTEDGKLVFSSPIQSQPPPRATSGSFGDFLKDIAPSALIPFAGPLAGALGSAGLSAGAAAAGSGAILGGGGAALTGGDIGRGALMGGAGAAIGNGIFGSSTPGSDPFLGEASVIGGGGSINPAVSYPVNALAPPVSLNNPEAVVGTSGTNVIPEFDYAAGGSPDYVRPMEDPYLASINDRGSPRALGFDPNSTVGNPFLGEASVLGGGGAMPPAVPVGGDPFLGEASVIGGGGTTAAVTPGLIAKVAAYTGLSTGAIERLGGAAISSLAGLYGAGMVGSAADRAAKGIADANASSNALLADIDARNRAREEPFYQAGVNALPAYTKGVMPGGDLVRPFSLDDFLANKDPGQKYRTDMGLDAIQASAVSRGLGKSGKTYLDLMRAGQDYASQEYDRAYARFNSDQATRRNALASLTGFAPTASSAIRSSDMAYGGNATNLASNTANAMAGAGATRASAYGNALAGIGQNAYNALSPNPFAQYLPR